MNMPIEQLEIISKLVTIAVGAVTIAKTYLEVKAPKVGGATVTPTVTIAKTYLEVKALLLKKRRRRSKK